MALEAVAFGSSENDRPKRRIMSVRHVRKQMVLDLMVKAASKPGREARTGREVRRRSYLVSSPIISRTNAVELHTGSEVRNLKDDCEHPAQDRVKEDESGDCPRYGQKQEGRRHNKKKIQALAGQQLSSLVLAQWRHVPLVQTTVGETAKVLPEQPLQRVQAVVENCFHFLAPKARVPRLRWRQTQKPSSLEIIVPANDIGLAVVKTLMLVHPEVPGWPQYCGA